MESRTELSSKLSSFFLRGRCYLMHVQICKQALNSLVNVLRSHGLDQTPLAGERD